MHVKEGIEVLDDLQKLTSVDINSWDYVLQKLRKLVLQKFLKKMGSLYVPPLLT